MEDFIEQRKDKDENVDRRPIKQRSAKWAIAIAASLAKAGVSPNFVSSMSVVFALIGGALLLFVPKLDHVAQIVCLVGVAACVLARLLCNMFDGMIAVEYGKQSKVGGVFNELPDRIADMIFLVPAGYAAQFGQLGIEIGWLAALLAVLTAYIRAFAVSLGLKNDFCGPMAKPHRMFVLAISSLVAVGEVAMGLMPKVIFYGLCIIVLGSIVTCVRRTMRMVNELKK